MNLDTLDPTTAYALIAAAVLVAGAAAIWLDHVIRSCRW